MANAYTFSTSGSVTVTDAPEASMPAATRRAQLSQAITHELGLLVSGLKPATVAFTKASVDHMFSVDAQSLSLLDKAAPRLLDGSLPASTLIQTDVGAAVLTPSDVQAILDAVSVYIAALPVASAGVHAALAATADADLAAFDVSGHAAWPSRSLTVDLASPPATPTERLAVWQAAQEAAIAANTAAIAALEARIAALEGA